MDSRLENAMCMQRIDLRFAQVSHKQEGIESMSVETGGWKEGCMQRCMMFGCKTMVRSPSTLRVKLMGVFGGRLVESSQQQAANEMIRVWPCSAQLSSYAPTRGYGSDASPGLIGLDMVCRES
jgi:hypothetical protein